MRRPSALELFLMQVIVYFLLWLYDDYLASLASLILGCMFLLILLISLLVEKIESSKVPPWYYTYMAASFLAPLVTGILFLLIYGIPDWLTG